MGIKRNSFSHNKSGIFRRGLNSSFVNDYIERTDPAKQDRENRKDAANRIIALVDGGMDLDKALTQVAEEKDIQEKFAYLIRQNVDIKPMLKAAYIAATSGKKPYYPHKDERGEK